MIESNLRKLFVEQNIVLHPFQETVPERGKVSIQSTPGFVGRSVLFYKRPDEVIYMIGEEGENILAIHRPRHVLLPLAQYVGDGNDPEYIEKAIQDRLQAILEAAATGALDHDEKLPEVPLEQITAFLYERLAYRGFAAILTNSKNQNLIINATKNWKEQEVPFFSYKDSLPEGVVYGIAKPEYLGYVVNDASPEVQPGEAFVGILCHGGVVAAQIKS